jgi:hypothetical protein
MSRWGTRGAARQLQGADYVGFNYQSPFAPPSETGFAWYRGRRTKNRRFSVIHSKCVTRIAVIDYKEQRKNVLGSPHKASDQITEKYMISS